MLACIIREDLENAGFTINEEKSRLYPMQVGKWLGFIIDTRAYQFAVPKTKIEKLCQLVGKEKAQKHTTARRVAKIAGRVIFMGPAIGPLTRLFTRRMCQFVESALSWDRAKRLDQGAIEEMNCWEDNLDAVNGYRIKER